jgi:eukaryotic-like serine/threonine-protein kinase
MTEPLHPTDRHSDLFAEGREETSPHETEQIAPEVPTAVGRTDAFKAGDCIQGDFVVLLQLGRGSFARVYLAQQRSLNRLVALKVSDKPAIAEAMTLAGLEHDHIVKVYAEFVDPQTRKHCLCLQYVPGTSLAHVIERLYQHGRPESGSAFMGAIDDLGSGETRFDPASATNRESLRRLPFWELVCRLGAQLAEALSFAHARGILHCDIKPANILLNPYGRPLLADFNVSVTRAPQREQRLGGTLDYMAPEHLAVFTNVAGREERVDHRADIYALGLVLFELATGKNAFVRKMTEGSTESQVRHWIAQRSEFPTDTGIPEPLERVIRRCLEPDPANRYQDGAELAAALKGAAEILAAQRRLPRGGRITRFAERFPFRTLVALTFLPHLIGSAVNITYNAVEIQLTEAQQQSFLWAILIYNGIIYPVCFALAYRVIYRVYRGWRDLDRGRRGADVDRVRGHLLSLSDWGIGLACLGWFPGALFFPLFIDAMAGGVKTPVYVHFAVSFILSGLIALIYSHFGIQFVTLRVLYPRLSNPDSTDGETVPRELDRAGRWFDLFQALAAVVPLTGAVLFLFAADDRLTLSVRLLAASLIVLGMIGVGVAVLVRYRLNLVIQTLVGVRVESAFPSEAISGYNIRRT